MKADVEQLPIGLVRGMPAEKYHADPSVSNTMLSAMNKSPAHCYGLHLDPQRPQSISTPAQGAGKLAHTAILEPDALLDRYVIRPADVDYRTKDGKAWRDAQTVEIITAAEHETALAQRAAVMGVPILRTLLSTGVAEASLFWNESRGLRCRARPDWLHFNGPKRAVVVDVKTISDLTPEKFSRSIAEYGYHRQQAHYSNGLKALGIEVEAFVFGVVSGSYPFVAAAYVLDDESIEQGREEVGELLDRFAWCKANSAWPAFGDDYQLISLPRWAKRTQEMEVSFAE